MSSNSPRLDLPYIQAGQAQKHVTHNEAVEQLDLITQLVVQDFAATTPPATPGAGQVWAIGAGATGAWSGRAGELAGWYGGGWMYLDARTGWRAGHAITGEMRVFDGTSWVAPVAGDLNALPGVGINASYDATNKLAVAADATLFNHDGAGHQLKLNKATGGDTASLLYQTGFSGRAEMGLAGDDDFAIKVSADGSAWTTALQVDAATGAVSLPATTSLQVQPWCYRHYLYADRRWTGVSADAASSNAAQNLGTGAEPNTDWDAKGVYVPAGTVIESLTLAGSTSNAEVADLDLRLVFQHGPWNASWDSTAETTRVVLMAADDAGVIGDGGMRQVTYALNYTAPADGYFSVLMRANAASTLTDTHYFYAAGQVRLLF